MGGTVSAGADNDELVDNLLEADYIKTAAVENVFRAVDRGHYFTVECKHNAYKDLAWKYGNVHISAPCIYSEVMENLKLAPGMSFLNLGSGTGYLSTMAGLILGSYGINHGVEIHEDVLNYAKKKLDEFCSTSPALDEYEFCQPKFVNGNCLHLGSEARQYDRVYCGAACPENHQNYMKNLIKVGGILVMPINDQLLQIYRISDTNWETKSVLPVSFASLICSHVPNTSEPLKMPDAEPLSLQDICRFAVRSILRRKIDMEHPELKKKPSRVPRKRVKKRTLGKFVIPIFGSHSDSEDNDVENDDRIGIRDFGRHGFLMDVHNMRTCRTFLELGQLLPGPSRRNASAGRSIDNDEEIHGGVSASRAAAREEESEKDGNEESGETENSQDECMTDCDANPSPKIEIDEDDVMKNGIEAAETPVAGRLSELSDYRSSIDKTRKVKEGKREKFDSGIVEDMENGKGTSSDSENHSDPGNTKDSENQNLFFKFEDSDTETAPSKTFSGKATAEIQNTEKSEAETANVKNYSSYMREKIKMLPLPMTLKYFVNLDRKL